MRNRPSTQNASDQPGSTASARSKGGSSAIGVPMKGTKRISPARNPQRIGFGTPRSHNPPPMKTPKPPFSATWARKYRDRRSPASFMAMMVRCRSCARPSGSSGHAIPAVDQRENDKHDHQRRRRQRGQYGSASESTTSRGLAGVVAGVATTSDPPDSTQDPGAIRPCPRDSRPGTKPSTAWTMSSKCSASSLAFTAAL